MIKFVIKKVDKTLSKLYKIAELYYSKANDTGNRWSNLNAI